MEIKIKLKKLLEDKTVKSLKLIRNDKSNFVVIVNDNILDSLENTMYYNNDTGEVVYKT
jgi:hypothetical protein